MSFFKKIFGSKQNGDQHSEPKKERVPHYDDVPWMTELRKKNLAVCHQAGFRPATSLPTELGRQLRPTLEIANRLHAIKAIVLWLMVPEEDLPGETVLAFVAANNLQAFMAEDERAILSLSRNDEAARNAIGWKFENAWPLAWYFGYTAPGIDGEMMSGEQMQDIIYNHTCPLEENINDWINSRTTISEESLAKTEDLFYCLHNAVRSAQMGSDTVPKGFDPIGNGGVIHERRHALTWMLSKDVDWDETDLST